MANHASAEKRNRQRVKRTTKNRAQKSELKTIVKKARGAISADSVKGAASALDRAASKGVIPTRRASRLKARLAKALHKASATK